MDGKTIMIVDDDVNIRRLLEIYISSEGYEAVSCQSGAEALHKMPQSMPSLVLLDVMMPEMDGFEVLRRIREKSNVPVIMLTARDLVEDKLLGFGLGADDYIVKPFEPVEVLARIKARLREGTQQRDKVLRVKNVVLDINSYEVTVGSKALPLKPKEIKLLQFMMSNQNIVLTRDEMLERVWDYTFGGGTRTVDMHIKRLREKLVSAGAEVSINTIWGVGYKLETNK